MVFALWKVGRNEERSRGRHARRAADNHVRAFIQILENVCNRAEKADRGVMEARAACTYFEKNVHRIELLRMNVENLLPKLDQDAKYAESVRRILDVAIWLVDTYHDPTLPADKRFYLWTSGAGLLESKTRTALREATSINIVKPLVID